MRNTLRILVFAGFTAASLPGHGAPGKWNACFGPNAKTGTYGVTDCDQCEIGNICTIELTEPIPGCNGYTSIGVYAIKKGKATGEKIQESVYESCLDASIGMPRFTRYTVPINATVRSKATRINSWQTYPISFPVTEATQYYWRGPWYKEGFKAVPEYYDGDVIGPIKSKKRISKLTNILYATGHLTPFQPFNFDQGKGNATFNILNRAPQYSSLNSGQWLQLETSVIKRFRNKTDITATVTTGTSRINENKIQLVNSLSKFTSQDENTVFLAPEAFWKYIQIKESGTPRNEAFYAKNDENKVYPGQWKTGGCSITNFSDLLFMPPDLISDFKNNCENGPTATSSALTQQPSTNQSPIIEEIIDSSEITPAKLQLCSQESKITVTAGKDTIEIEPELSDEPRDIVIHPDNPFCDMGITYNETINTLDLITRLDQGAWTEHPFYPEAQVVQECKFTIRSCPNP